LRDAIAAIRHLRGPRLLYTDEGETVTAKSLQRWMARVQRRASLRNTGNLHVLRPTFCSHLAMAGAPVPSIQKLAGHKHMHTTMRYMHLAQGETDRAIRMLERSHAAGRERLDQLGDMLETASVALAVGAVGGSERGSRPSGDCPENQGNRPRRREAPRHDEA
ncbi:MAG: site-specific integrase, partial [Deltaproteobacteria bacterium]|nr:site-specific integrase [Deltaproteobacteria bacterium]